MPGPGRQPVWTKLDGAPMHPEGLGKVFTGFRVHLPVGATRLAPRHLPPNPRAVLVSSNALQQARPPRRGPGRLRERPHTGPYASPNITGMFFQPLYFLSSSAVVSVRVFHAEGPGGPVQPDLPPLYGHKGPLLPLPSLLLARLCARRDTLSPSHRPPSTLVSAFHSTSVTCKSPWLTGLVPSPGWWSVPPSRSKKPRTLCLMRCSIREVRGVFLLNGWANSWATDVSQTDRPATLSCPIIYFK